MVGLWPLIAPGFALSGNGHYTILTMIVISDTIIAINWDQFFFFTVLIFIQK